MKKKKLKKLIERLTAAGSNGTYTASGGVRCFFCETEEGKAHEKQCPYVEALNVLGKQDKLTYAPVVEYERTHTISGAHHIVGISLGDYGNNISWNTANKGNG